jgi:hypothetical protein
MIRTLALAGLLVFPLLTSCSSQQSNVDINQTTTKETKMSDSDLLMGSFDRPPPPEVPPVVRDGRRYVQHIGTYDEDIGQSGGLLDILDDATGKLIATVKVYDNTRRSDLEGDVQDIFFEAMEFDEAGKLIITDEVGRRYSVDTVTHKAEPLP